ncbi:DUF5064 family protein [Streptomyces griseofuscus]|uniref:DUF5064 family protein n=1 Tax=Streptomyces griseofuscus TaxID=146922 RepID=UPI003688EFBC
MASFTPGCLRIEQAQMNRHEPSYALRIEYEVANDPAKGQGVQFRLHGTIEGKTADETFFLPEDQVRPSALPRLTRMAQSYLTPPAKFAPLGSDKVYEAMFDDIQAKLSANSGDSAKAEAQG